MSPSSICSPNCMITWTACPSARAAIPLQRCWWLIPRTARLGTTAGAWRPATCRTLTLVAAGTVTTTSTIPDPSLGSKGRRCSAETNRPSRRPSLG
jgi:hypothetical protein